MIATSSKAAQILTRHTFKMSCRATVTRRGVVLAANIPVDSGWEECDDDLRVPERVTLRIPRYVGTTDYAPQTPFDPLAPYGQRIHIKIGVDLGNGDVEWLNRGEFLIYETSLDGEAIDVTAVGLLFLHQEAGFIGPFHPGGLTYRRAIRSVVEPGLTMRVDPYAELATDGDIVPQAINYDGERLEALQGLLEAWRARAQVHPNGYLWVTDSWRYPTGPTLQRYNFTTPDGIDQNLASVQHESSAMSRRNIYNVVVMRGQYYRDGAPITGVAIDAASWTGVRSGFNPMPVPYYAFNPILDRPHMVQAAAKTTLQRLRYSTDLHRRYEIEAVPDPRVLLNDRCAYRRIAVASGELEVKGVVEKLRMPYTSGQGPMQITLREAGTGF